jgi:hypothetical protein
LSKRRGEAFIQLGLQALDRAKYSNMRYLVELEGRCIGGFRFRRVSSISGAEVRLAFKWCTGTSIEDVQLDEADCLYAKYKNVPDTAGRSCGKDPWFDAQFLISSNWNS